MLLNMPRLRTALTAILALTAASASADTFNLRIGSGHPSAPTIYVNQIEKFFVPEVVKRVKERTSHTITFTEAYGGSVAKVAETLTAVESGLLDIGAYCVCFELSRLPVHNFPFWVPFGPSSAAAAQRATRKVYDEFPQLSEVLEKKHAQRLLGLGGVDNYHLGTTFAWDKLSDLKGRKVGAAGINLPWLQGSGAVGVSTTLPEVYNSLKSGVFDGIIMFPSSYLGFKLQEPAPHYKLAGFGAVMVYVMTINNRTFNRLPKEVQAILVEVGREYENRQGGLLDEGNKAGLEKLAASGAKITEISADARRAWAEGMKDWPNKMAKDADKTGGAGSSVLKAYLRHLNAEGWNGPVAYAVQ